LSDSTAAPDESRSVPWQNRQSALENISVGGNLTTGDIDQGIHIHLPPPPTTEPKHFTVPYPRNVYFTGRDNILSQLHEALRQSGTAALSQANAISGLGGVGKTQTAVEYAYRYFEQESGYDWVLWVNASNLTLAASFGALATDLALPNHRENKLDENTAAVLHWLETTDCWLLIFDNVDDPQAVKPFRPQNPKGRMLFTSRVQRLESLGVGRAIALDTMTAAEAAEFLWRRTERSPLAPLEKEGTEPDVLKVSLFNGDLGGSNTFDSDEQRSIAALAQTLGYLPLALEQAAAYILEDGVTFTDYLDEYRQSRLQLLEEQKPQTGHYPDSVATTWKINFAAVTANSPAAADLLSLSAFLAPDNIPYELLKRGKEQFGEWLSQALENAAEKPLVLPKLLKELTRYSLIRLETDDRYSIHRMVQEALRDALTPEQRQQWIDRTVAALNQTFPDPEFENWRWCDRLVEQVQAIELPQANQTIELGLLLNQTGYFLNEQGRYEEAEPLYLQALDIRRSQLGDTHPFTATSLNNLAVLYQSQGRYADAEPLCLQALDIWRLQLGETHPFTATSLNNLAELYQSQGRYADAEPLYLQALDIWRLQLGETHPFTATSLNNLAGLYRSQGCYADAEPLYLQALEITRLQLGETHPTTATSLNNLALLYKSQGRYADAEPLYLQTLEIRRSQLGETHPDTAASLSNLAGLYRAQGRYADAEPLLLQALHIRRSQLGETHPSTATSLNNLAGLYQSQGRYAEAELLLLQALHIRRSRLGETHPDTAGSLNNLAGLYKLQGRYTDAEPLYLQALEIRRSQLGDTHPDTAGSLNNLATLYKSQGRYNEAEPLYLQTLAILMQSLGENHPNTQTTWNKFVYLLQQAIEAGRAAQLSDHPLTQHILVQLQAEPQ